MAGGRLISPVMKEEVFIGGWTKARLRERSQSERHAVWKRARALHSAEGNHLARAIEMLGLPYAEPEPLAGADPLLERMKAVFAAPAARSAAVEATLDGLPALAGIDTLLHEELGQEYRRNPASLPTKGREELAQASASAACLTVRSSPVVWSTAFMDRRILPRSSKPSSFT